MIEAEFPVNCFTDATNWECLAYSRGLLCRFRPDAELEQVIDNLFDFQFLGHSWR
jgi:hypothetical protein